MLGDFTSRGGLKMLVGDGAKIGLAASVALRHWLGGRVWRNWLCREAPEQGHGWSIAPTGADMPWSAKAERWRRDFDGG